MIVSLVSYQIKIINFALFAGVRHILGAVKQLITIFPDTYKRFCFEKSYRPERVVVCTAGQFKSKVFFS